VPYCKSSAIPPQTEEYMYKLTQSTVAFIEEKLLLLYFIVNSHDNLGKVNRDLSLLHDKVGEVMNNVYEIVHEQKLTNGIIGFDGSMFSDKDFDTMLRIIIDASDAAGLEFFIVEESDNEQIRSIYNSVKEAVLEEVNK